MVDFEHAGGIGRLASILPGQAPFDFRRIVDLAEVVADALDLKPVTLRIDHAPPGEVVDCGAPEHGFFAARVHGDVAADAGSINGGGVDGEDKARALGGLGHPARDDARLGVHRGYGLGVSALGHAGQSHVFDGGNALQFLGVDDGRKRGERDGATRVARAAAARDHAEAELDASAHETGDFVLVIGADDNKGIFDTPVGGVGHVRDAGERIKTDGIAARVPRQQSSSPRPQFAGPREMLGKVIDRDTRRLQQKPHLAIALLIGGAAARVAALVDFTQAVIERRDQ